MVVQSYNVEARKEDRGPMVEYIHFAILVITNCRKQDMIFLKIYSSLWNVITLMLFERMGPVAKLTLPDALLYIYI